MRGGKRGEDQGEERTLTIMLVPDGGRRTRFYRIPYRWLKWLGPAVVLVVLGGVAMIGSWGYLTVRANEARILEEEVAHLRERESRVGELAQSLGEAEAAYDQVRGLFGAAILPDAGDLWLPRATGRPLAGPFVQGNEAELPTSWPLTERGFITQALLAGAGEEHPGVDIAIPGGSYVRAVGSGTVGETGHDLIYGNFVVIDHGTTYQTRYAHVSLILVAEGDPVRRNEVIALSGSSGRSTAPHLHFEVIQEGVPIDPLLLVTQP